MTHLWIAYSIISLVILGYVFFMGQKQSRIIKEIQNLKDLYKD